MVLRRRALVLLPVPPLLTVPRTAFAARARVGEVSALTGEAEARFSGDPPRVLAPAAPLLLDDLINTGPAAKLAALLEGGIEVRLGERASLRVDTLVLRGPQPGVTLRVFGGPALLDRPPQPGAAPIALVLPWARIGVRGTRVWAGPLDGRYAVFVARGRVQVDAGGIRTELDEGEGVDVPEVGAPPLPVVRWGQARIARALETVL